MEFVADIDSSSLNVFAGRHRRLERRGRDIIWNAPAKWTREPASTNPIIVMSNYILQ